MLGYPENNLVGQEGVGQILMSSYDSRSGMERKRGRN